MKIVLGAANVKVAQHDEILANRMKEASERRAALEADVLYYKNESSPLLSQLVAHKEEREPRTRVMNSGLLCNTLRRKQL